MTITQLGLQGIPITLSVRGVDEEHVGHVVLSNTERSRSVITLDTEQSRNLRLCSVSGMCLFQGKIDIIDFLNFPFIQ
jgi:hypothetical protein